jgi:large subunit ribosomal protein L28
MAKVCMVTGKGTARGNHVAHCNKKVKRTFQTNVHTKRFWLAGENRWISLKVSTRGMRTIDKKGIEVVLAELRSRGAQV